MKRIAIAVLIPVVLTVGFAFAQEEGITLESLAEQLTDLTKRVESLERFWQSEGAPEKNGTCAIARFKDDETMKGWAKLQRESSLKYFDKYEESLPSHPHVVGVEFNPESNRIAVTYISNLRGYGDRKIITEVWNGCDFSGTNEWQEIE